MKKRLIGRELYEMWAGEEATNVAFGIWDDLTDDQQNRWNRLASMVVERDLLDSESS